MRDRPDHRVRVAPGLRLVSLGLALLGSPGLATTTAASDIPWRTGFEAAEAEARAAGRPLWMQFTGSWCTFCRQMDAETLAHARVAALGREAFIPLKVDADVRPDLLARYGLGGLPATVVVDPPTGRVLARHEGFADPGTFLALLGSARPPAPPAAGPAPEIALAGYDPVSLVSGEGLAVGDPALAVQHDGLEFRFADDRDRDAFLADPERYLPVVRGRCPVSLRDRREQVPGDPQFGIYYRGRLYLCADEAARRRFAEDPARYADLDLAEGGHCPHCRSLAGRLVRGLPQFAATYRGRRYLFPDPEHRAAFRSAPETYLR